MKTLSKRLKAEKAKTKQLLGAIEREKALNRQAEKMIHNRDREKQILQVQLDSSMRCMVVMADIIGDSFSLAMEEIRDADVNGYMICYEDGKIIFSRKARSVK